VVAVVVFPMVSAPLAVVVSTVMLLVVFCSAGDGKGGAAGGTGAAAVVVNAVVNGGVAPEPRAESRRAGVSDNLVRSIGARQAEAAGIQDRQPLLRVPTDVLPVSNDGPCAGVAPLAPPAAKLKLSPEAAPIVSVELVTVRVWVPRLRSGMRFVVLAVLVRLATVCVPAPVISKVPRRRRPRSS